jgi:hypothetical protein
LGPITGAGLKSLGRYWRPTSSGQKELSMERNENIAAIRRLADILEEHPNTPIPWNLTPSGCISIMCLSRAEFVASIKAFGNGKKADGGDSLDFTPDFPLKINIHGFKSAICEARVTKIEVPEQIIPATEQQVIPAHTEERVEYSCHESFLDGSEDLK